MASITIRNLDPRVKERLRLRAAKHGHSMENEARQILHAALSTSVEPTGQSLVDAIRARFAKVGFVDIELPPRELAEDPPSFE